MSLGSHPILGAMYVPCSIIEAEKLYSAPMVFISQPDADTAGVNYTYENNGIKETGITCHSAVNRPLR